MNAKNTVFNIKSTINAGGRLIDMSEPVVMGIINNTPDSFYAGSRKQDMDAILKQAEMMLAEGAAILDIGGYSSRPGADEVNAGEEARRVLPAIKAILQRFPETCISVDTFRADIAEAAIAEGARIVNDISGGQLDEKMFETIGRLNVPYILMHMRGTPQTMNRLTGYQDMFAEMVDYFSSKLYQLRQLHVHDVIIDPGFGFAKTIDQNFELLSRLNDFKILGLPVLAGLSRKATVWKTLNSSSNDALNGTTVLNTVALLRGANILRVHDVKEAVEAIQLIGRIKPCS